MRPSRLTTKKNPSRAWMSRKMSNSKRKNVIKLSLIRCRKINVAHRKYFISVSVCVLFTSSSMGPSASFSTSPWLLEEMSLFCTSSSGDRRTAFSVWRRPNKSWQWEAYFSQSTTSTMLMCSDKFVVIDLMLVLFWRSILMFPNTYFKARLKWMQ